MSNSQHSQQAPGSTGQSLHSDSSEKTSALNRPTWQQQQILHMDGQSSGAQAPDLPSGRLASGRGRRRPAGQQQLNWQLREPAPDPPPGRLGPDQRQLNWRQRDLYAEQDPHAHRGRPHAAAITDHTLWGASADDSSIAPQPGLVSRGNPRRPPLQRHPPPGMRQAAPDAGTRTLQQPDLEPGAHGARPGGDGMGMQRHQCPPVRPKPGGSRTAHGQGSQNSSAAPQPPSHPSPTAQSAAVPHDRAPNQAYRPVQPRATGPTSSSSGNGRTENGHAGRRARGVPAAVQAALQGLRSRDRLADGAATNGGSGGARAKGAEGEAHACVICVGSLEVVAVGLCNHKDVCARCALRMRLNYKDTTCPLCKTELQEVFLTRRTSEGVPDFEALQARSDAMWRRPQWARGVTVDNASTPAPERPLSQRMQAITARACSVCDAGGERPFTTNKLLQQHVHAAHKRQLCPVCLGAARRFPLELEARPRAAQEAHMSASLYSVRHSLEAARRFPLELEARPRAAQEAHMAGEHARCEFCALDLYSGDELFEHMRDRHFTCQVCLRAGRHCHFETVNTLEGHLRQEHFLCEEPECAGCLAAFATKEELQQHWRGAHSRAMPRFDRSRARPLHLHSEPFSNVLTLPSRPTTPGRTSAPRQPMSMPLRSQRSDSAGRSSAAASRGAPAAANGTSNTAAADGGARSGASSREPTPPAAERGAGESQTRRHVEGAGTGLVMIDDDVFPSARPAASTRGSSGLPAEQHGPALQEADEEFPSLGAWGSAQQPAGAHAEAAPARGAAGNGHAPRRPALAPLRKVTVHCECGRRTSHLALPEGRDPAPLRCDAECRRAQRQNRLADAFGIDDPAHHVPWVDRQREAHYTPELLLYAWHNPSVMTALEAQLHSFLTDTSKKRTALPPAPKSQRQIAYELAAQYGLASQSFGNEPSRHIQLFKVEGAVVPRQLLSAAAAATALEDLERAVRAEQGHSVHFTDVAASVDLHRILDRWEGQFVLSGPYSDGTAVARCSQPAAQKEVLDLLGGGIRGQFRLNRTATSAAAAALPRQASPVPPPAVPSASSAASGQPVQAPAAAPSAEHSVHGSYQPAGARRRYQPMGGGLDPSAVRAADMAFGDEAPSSTSYTIPKTRAPALKLPPVVPVTTHARFSELYISSPREKESESEDSGLEEASGQQPSDAAKDDGQSSNGKLSAPECGMYESWEDAA